MTHYCSANSLLDVHANRANLKPVAVATGPSDFLYHQKLYAQLHSDFLQEANLTKAYASTHPDKVVRIDGRAPVNGICNG